MQSDHDHDHTGQADDLAKAFEEHRPRLRGLAYRMLGSLSEAEDVTQDTWLRWAGTDPGAREAIGSVEAFLVRIATRLCLDRLKSARHRREVYKGPWLPDPVPDTEALTPLDAAELADDLSFALMLALERLSPAERAAFLLHDVFDQPYSRIAATLDRTEPTCRQLVSRARRAVRRERPAPETVPTRAQRSEEHDRLLQAFMAASVTGNTTELEALLAPGATFLSDGGGRVPAALNPIVGRDKVVRLIQGLRKQHEASGLSLAFERTVLNSRPALLVVRGGKLEQTISLETRDGLITVVYIVRNPDKLAHLIGD